MKWVELVLDYSGWMWYDVTMSRSPKPPFNLDIQSLSTGEPIREQAMPDDFGGEAIAMAEVYGPFKPPIDVDTLEHQRSEHKLSAAKAVLYRAGWYGVVDKPNTTGPIKRRM